jgi:hypothetical protein
MTWAPGELQRSSQENISMKKILSLMLGLTFVFGTLAIAQDTSQGSTDTSKSSKKHKKSKKSKSDKMSSDTSSAPKQ